VDEVEKEPSGPEYVLPSRTMYEADRIRQARSSACESSSSVRVMGSLFGGLLSPVAGQWWTAGRACGGHPARRAVPCRGGEDKICNCLLPLTRLMSPADPAIIFLKSHQTEAQIARGSSSPMGWLTLQNGLATAMSWRGPACCAYKASRPRRDVAWPGPRPQMLFGPTWKRALISGRGRQVAVFSRLHETHSRPIWTA
jgi:hypothetical protein